MMSTSNRTYPAWLTLSLLESESDQKYENKYDIIDIYLYPIRFYAYVLYKEIMFPIDDFF